MPIMLFDPSSQTLQPLVPGTLPHTAPTRGPSTGLESLRRAFIEDVLQRLLGSPPGPEALARSGGLAAEEARALGGTYDPLTLRHWALASHYRAPLVLEPPVRTDPPRYLALDESESFVTYLLATQQRLRTLPADRILPVQSAPPDALVALADALELALEADLDTPAALAAVSSFLAAVNALCDGALRKAGRVNQSAVDAASAGFVAVEALLGLGAVDPLPALARLRSLRAHRQGVDPEEVDATIARRAAARAGKDFATADALQASLLEQGITVLDGPEGTRWAFV